ncbi:MAG: HipA domain-containing protein [Acidimicrobiales bacterium]
MELDVWLHGRHVATLFEQRRQMTMRYTEATGPRGAPLVSMAMPVATTRFPDRIARAFFHGLLPEGEARRMLAYDFGLDVSNDMGLLAQLGKDCAGALVVQPAGDAPPLAATIRGGDVVDGPEIARRLAQLPVHPLGVDGRIRVSLAGVQSKLLLARRPDGTWSLPSEGVISTHIVKPAHRDLPDSVANEAFCMNLAGRAGLAAAPTTIGSFGGVEVLVSQRYDRQVDGNGMTERVHQEDACQALSVLTVVPEHKYETFGGPSLAGVAGLLEQWGDISAKEDLLGQVAFHVVVGNADAHGKNVSFLHREDGTVELAPLYDVMSTVYYSEAGRPMDPTPGLLVNGNRNIEQVTVGDIIDEAGRWGMRDRTARSVVDSLLERLPESLEQAVGDIPKVPGLLVDLIRNQVQDTRSQTVRPGHHLLQRPRPMLERRPAEPIPSLESLPPDPPVPAESPQPQLGMRLSPPS